MKYTFYVVDKSEHFQFRVYANMPFPSKEVAEKRAKQVSMLMGGVAYGIEEVKQ